MTAIYGLVHFDRRAVEPADLESMAEALRYWGPDGGGSWTSSDRAAALGQLVTHNLPESVRESGPVVSANGSVLTVSARLDNREELVRELGLHGDATESAIVAAAWDRWGRAAPEHLYGDWLFAAWDDASKRLFIARDHLGNTALYYHWTGSSLAFASSRKALFALPFVPRRLNELRVAQHLAMWITDGHATFHEEISRLPSAHHLTATADGPEVARYWFPERIAEVRLRSDEEYVERFLELYSTAVRVRMRSRGAIVTTLSAGLDSTSVTALAARHHGNRLIAYTAVPLDPDAANRAPGDMVDEWRLAHEAAEWIGAVDHRPLCNPSITPLAALERSLWLHDEPEFGAANLYWVIDLMEQSCAAGAGVLLTGQMGNGGVSWAGDKQRVLRGLLRGRWIDAARAMRARRQAYKTSLLGTVWSQIVRPLRAKLESARFRLGWIRPPGWGGTTSHGDDLARIAPAIVAFCKRHPEAIFAYMGDAALFARLFGDLAAAQTRVRAFGPYEEYLQFISGLDVGLAPLGASAFNACRTDTKFATYAARGVAALLEDSDVYRVHADRAVVFASAAELDASLESLYADPARRASVADRAYEWAARERSPERLRAQRIAAYERLIPREAIEHSPVEALPPAYDQERLTLCREYESRGEYGRALELLEGVELSPLFADVAATLRSRLLRRVRPDATHPRLDRAGHPYDYIALANAIRELLANDPESPELPGLCLRACLIAPELVPAEHRPAALRRYLPA